MSALKGRNKGGILVEWEPFRRSDVKFGNEKKERKGTVKLRTEKKTRKKVLFTFEGGHIF